MSYSRQYLALVKVLSALLYAYDPQGYGISVGAPDDEYDDFAARLILDLSKIEGRNEQIKAFQSKCADAPDLLSEAVVAVMQLYADAKNAHPLKRMKQRPHRRTSGCNRPPASRAAAEPLFRYADDFRESVQTLTLGKPGARAGLRSDLILLPLSCQ